MAARWQACADLPAGESPWRIEPACMARFRRPADEVVDLEPEEAVEAAAGGR